VIIIIEERWPGEATHADMVADLKALEPRRVLVDMIGPQAGYLPLLLAEGFHAEPLHYSIRKRLA
jgi:hypothetical protein